MTQELRSFQIRVPAQLHEWEYLRGTLYCMSPVLQHMTLVLSSRVEPEVGGVWAGSVCGGYWVVRVPAWGACLAACGTGAAVLLGGTMRCHNGMGE